nr:hypothetical protein [Tanacetum cinerariifolium]
MDAATVLVGETNVPTGSGFIPTAGPPATVISTGSEVGPTASPIVTRRNGKEVMVESDTLKKKKLQEQIDSQVARELEEKQEREDMRMNEQRKLPLEKKIELISDLVKYQEHYTKVHKFQSQQRKPMTKKQKREYYMAVIKTSPLRYALTVKPTIFVSHIRQFWSTARIKTKDEGTHILATVDDIQKTVSESYLRRNLKLRDEDGIVSIPDMELFENLTLGIVPLFDTMLIHQGEGSGTPTEPHHTPSPEVDTSHLTTSSILLPSLPTAPIPPVTQTDTTPIRQYSRRARIAQSFPLPTVADEPASPVRDVSKREACPTKSGFIADQDRATVAKSSTLPHDLAPRVTSFAADEGSMQHTIFELTTLYTSLQRQHSELLAKFQAQEVETLRSINEGEAAAERISNDSEEIVRVLTSMDAATVLAGGIDVPTSSGSIPTAGPLATNISTGSEVAPTAKQQEKDDMRMNEQIARDAEVVRIHAVKELQGMIDSLDRSNETIAKYLPEYQDFASELPLEKRIELISDLVKYQENYSKVYKFQSQQRRPMTKKQKKDYYMAMIRNNLGWKVKDFKGMTFEEIEAKFAAVWMQVEDFIPIGSKEEAERLKRKGLNLEQEHVKKQKTSKEDPKIEKSTKEISKEKMKEMMLLVPVEDVYVQALQVKHPIIDWKVHIKGHRSYWNIIRLGDSSACYQFFIDLLKQLDREDLNQLWALVALKRLYEPDPEDQLWAQTQNYMHAPTEWKLYDLSGVYHVTAKDKEIFMLVEKDYPLRKGLALVMISYKLQGRIVGNKMHKAFPLLVKKLPLPEGTPHCLKKNATARRKVLPLLVVCTAIIVKEKPSVKDDSFL